MSEVTQADREAAHTWWMHREHDERDLPAYFARHREAAAAEERIKVEAQAAEIEKLREALEYYADRNNPCPNEGPWGVDSTDFGLVALNALRETK